ncbi:HI0933-like protein [hydrothermal vent metagenome]|uniref:HI0933-like protein n=1 Tax=hydrothermal vent metagenome TaxID=652676 RepID=A0A1W1C8W8_9ZZZZ
MMSKKQKKLYFVGEVLDVVGRRGGYNFAFAWSSAYLAANNITK